MKTVYIKTKQETVVREKSNMQRNNPTIYKQGIFPDSTKQFKHGCLMVGLTIVTQFYCPTNSKNAKASHWSDLELTNIFS